MLFPTTGRFPPNAIPRSVNLIEHFLSNPRVLELKVLPPQLERDACVLDTVVRVDLDTFLEEVPSQELEAKFAAVVLLVKQVDGVDGLRFGDLNVDHTEVALEAMAHELASEVEQDPKSFVGHFE